MFNLILLRIQPWLRPILFPFALLYALGMRLRAWAYARGLLDSISLSRACISVGNISWGGSGKTPLCMWLLDWAINRKQTPVLISRGYKARPPAFPYLVKPSDQPDKSGDEPLMISQAHPEASIIIDPQRRRAGKWALNYLGPDLFVLDDAFQHLQVKRNLDLVLLRPQDLERDWNLSIPAGSWREGKAALHRASAFLLNLEPARFRQLEDKLTDRLLPFCKPIFSFYLQIQGAIRVEDKAYEALPANEPYLLVTAVGDPDKVLQSTSKSLGHLPEKHLAFSDHHFFSEKDWRFIRAQAGKLGCKQIFCTPKDAVKLNSFADSLLWTFDLRLQFGPYLNSNSNFPKWLEKTLLF
jgi:tetraacyldisaccharide 4'-kinase